MSGFAGYLFTLALPGLMISPFEMEKAFVFAVCGGREHIETLQSSLKTFKLKSKAELIVVTDSGRNEVALIHDRIVDVRTPGHLDHHQASIYLKTSLHRILPPGKQYCYLDSDILALGDHVDDIFEQYKAPIRFAADHCIMPLFSPSALNCGCKEKYDQFIDDINDYIDRLDPYRSSADEAIMAKRETLKRELVKVFKNKPHLFWNGIKYFLSWPHFKFHPDFYFNRRKKLWLTKDHQPIMTIVQWPRVAKKFGLRYNYLTMDVKFPNGRSIWVNQCDHLAERITEKFGIPVIEKEWQHWNGGVFLWDDASHAFLDTWHDYTKQIFEDPAWKTRDQGTLIATVWKFGLQKHPVLDKKWNFICDYNNQLFSVDQQKSQMTDDGKNYVAAELAHVYHHYGDASWDFWNWAYAKALGH